MQPGHLPCPCGSSLAYADCCARWHLGLKLGEHAPTPEALMRSRYSAYVLRLRDYLLATWYPATSPGELELAPLKWLGLEVRHAEQSGDAGVVEFVARCTWFLLVTQVMIPFYSGQEAAGVARYDYLGNSVLEVIVITTSSVA